MSTGTAAGGEDEGPHAALVRELREVARHLPPGPAGGEGFADEVVRLSRATPP